MKKIMLLVGFIIAACGNLAFSSAYSDAVPQITNERDFQDYVGMVADKTYKAINDQIVFNSEVITLSTKWDVVRFLNRPILIKKRGIPLSEAIADLLDPNSKTEFECTNALNIFMWSVVLHPRFKVDHLIATLEARDPEFRLPLIMENILQTLLTYAQSAGFHARRGVFTIGSTAVVMEEEWAKLSRLRQNFERISSLFATRFIARSAEGFVEDSRRGAMSYLANIPGVVGPIKGQNLVSIGGGRYWGFGPEFQTGPKTLKEIGDVLETAIPKIQFESVVTKKVRTLAAKKNVHPLQLMVASTPGYVFDFAALKNAAEQLLGCQICGNKGKLLQCARCHDAYYCSVECQKKDWPSHKNGCKPSK